MGELKVMTGGFKEEEKDLEETTSNVVGEVLEEESSAGEDIKEFIVPIGRTAPSP